MNSPFIPELYRERLIDIMTESVMLRIFPPMVKRTVRERLFTVPWRPWRKYKLGEMPAITTPGTLTIIHGPHE